jgi:deoxyribonucleoside regulator
LNKRQLLARVAQMYYKEKLNQQQIAEMVGLSRSQVSRYLTEAEESGVVRIEIEEVDDRAHDLEARLEALLGIEKAVVVYQINSTAASIRKTIGRAAAHYLNGILVNRDVIGLTSGYTLREMLHYLERPDVQDLELIQLMGGGGATALQTYPEELAREFAQKLDATLFSLHAPLVVENKEIRDLFLSTGSVKKVIDKWETLSVVVMGVGNISPEQLIFKSGWFTAEEFDSLQAAGAVGVICGRFFDQHGRLINVPVVERVISTRLETIQKANHSIAVAGGNHKAQPLLAAVRGGICNTVVTDDRTATEILELAVRTP